MLVKPKKDAAYKSAVVGYVVVDGEVHDVLSSQLVKSATKRSSDRSTLNTAFSLSDSQEYMLARCSREAYSSYMSGLDLVALDDMSKCAVGIMFKGNQPLGIAYNSDLCEKIIADENTSASDDSMSNLDMAKDIVSSAAQVYNKPGLPWIITPYTNN